VPNINLKAASIAGFVAGVAYAVTAEIDNRITGQNVDDLKLLGRPFVPGPKYAKLAGIPVHLFNSVSLAWIYPRFRHLIPGNAVTKGIIFATIENSVLYPIVALERFHPGIRNGEIERYFTLKAYLQSVPRHIAYGATVGLLYDRLARVI
jgi:hypothetical protein